MSSAEADFAAQYLDGLRDISGVPVESNDEDDLLGRGESGDEGEDPNAEIYGGLEDSESEVTKTAALSCYALVTENHKKRRIPA